MLSQGTQKIKSFAKSFYASLQYKYYIMSSGIRIWKHVLSLSSHGMEAKLNPMGGRKCLPFCFCRAESITLRRVPITWSNASRNFLLSVLPPHKQELFYYCCNFLQAWKNRVGQKMSRSFWIMQFTPFFNTKSHAVKNHSVEKQEILCHANFFLSNQFTVKLYSKNRFDEILAR